jgi:anti-sigma factor RsiW
VNNDDHEKVEALMTKWLEGAASEPERALAEFHLGTCPACRAAIDKDRKATESLRREVESFTRGFDAGKLELNLALDVRQAKNQARWGLALGAAFGAITVAIFVHPLSSQPQAWTATLSLAGGFLGAFAWGKRLEARRRAIARAALEGRSGYPELRRARLRLAAREFRTVGRGGLVFAFVLPALILLTGAISRLQLGHAFPGAKIKVHVGGALLNAVTLSVLAIAVSVLLLRKARRVDAELGASQSVSCTPTSPAGPPSEESRRS